MEALVFDRPMMYPPIDGSRDYWELAYDWTVFFGDKVFALKKGFRTDGASIPRFLWRLCGTPLESPRVYAALVHDFLYDGGCPGTTRAEADEVYRDMQLALGIRPYKARVEWMALRMFGGSHWNDGIPG